MIFTTYNSLPYNGGLYNTGTAGLPLVLDLPTGLIGTVLSQDSFGGELLGVAIESDSFGQFACQSRLVESDTFGQLNPSYTLVLPERN